MKSQLFAFALALIGAISATAAPPAGADGLQAGFVKPPDSARPWVYWFWLNGNITKEGITADLTAMKRVGIGGVLIMETDQGAPLGPIPFASPKWRELFHRVVSEAHRLGLQVNMNDDAGWAGSGGPWITPEKSMQKVVWSETPAEGAKRFEGTLAKPAALAGYYRDIAVLAFPTPGSYRISEIAGKAAFVRRDAAPTVVYGSAPPYSVIDKSNIVDLTARMDSAGRVSWDVPPGQWTIMRFGHTSTGVTNEPSPLSGLGLECDKLSKEGSEAAFNGFIGKLVADSGPLAGNSFVRMHIDSWEVGSQNWTARFREEFRKRRGYDLLPYLPVFSGRVVGSLEVSERFLWDLRLTVSDLLLENYEGHMQGLAARRGIHLSTEAYGDMTMDDLAYGGRADEPMGEFWTWNGDIGDPKSHSDPSVIEMVSAAHVYGRHIVGAESFTSDDSERWRYYPGVIKAMGDLQIARGVNRFVVHRYALQPWLNVKPGMSMGPWGLHYERTATWWDESSPWHAYLSRCQYLLQQGLPVVDLLYLAPEGAPSSFNPPEATLHGPYRADACPPDALMNRAIVKNRRIVFPDGMSYGALVLPSGPMTAAVLRKVKEIAEAGAIVIGQQPSKSPSLSGYPACDDEVERLAAALWSSGKVISDKTAEQALAAKGVVPDFSGSPRLSAAHRRFANTDVYFVANTSRLTTNAICTFRIVNKQPEIWNPETGQIQQVVAYTRSRGRVSIPLSFGASDSLFVVFKPIRGAADPVTRFTRGGVDVLAAAPASKIVVKQALWGPKGDATRTKDVTEQVQRILDRQVASFRVADLAVGGDPALNVVKTLRLEYEVDGKTQNASATDPETIVLWQRADQRPKARLEVRSGRLAVAASALGEYSVRTQSGRILRASLPSVPSSLPVTGSWSLSFPAAMGAPKEVAVSRLGSWSESSVPGVRFFSGTATYRKSVVAPQTLFGRNLRQYLDLGSVEVIAEVRLNGKNLGILWRPPFRVDVTSVLRPGKNELEVRITNLWPNRMIGDESLPEDGNRNPNGTLKTWPSWVQKGGKSPTGRITFSSWKLWHKQDALLPSGLIGPVTIQPEAIATLRLVGSAHAIRPVRRPQHRL